IRQTNCFYNLDDCMGRVGGGREDFQHPDSSAFYPNAIGKRSSGIDGDTKTRGLRRARHSGGERYSSTYSKGLVHSAVSAGAHTRARAPAPAPHRDHHPLLVNASVSSVFCSTSCALGEPVAGLALAVRFTERT